MPNYKTHDTAAYIAAPVFTYALTTVLPLDTALATGVAFLVANRWLSPDLDIDSILNRRWGFLIALWYPYRKVVHHRSFLSHSGPFSAAIRLLYLMFWILIPLLLLIPVSALITALVTHWTIIVLFYVAMAAADTLHTILDFIT